MTGHDQLFKDLFREFFPELLYLADPDLAARLTAGSRGFTFLDKEVFLDWPEGRRREADLVAQVPGRSGKRKLLIQVEIENQFRGAMGRRLWRYSNQLDLRYGVPVVTIVVFLRGGPPGAQWIDHVEQVTGRTIHRFTYLSLGLSGIPSGTLLSRSEPLAWALAALARRPGKMGRARLKLDLLRKIATAPVNQARRFLLTNCVETYLQLTGRVAEQYAALCAAQVNPEVEAMRLTWADRMEIEYEQRGIEKGREEGTRQTLLRLLGKRFGAVSPAVREQVEAISSIEELGGLVDRILEVKSIEELGLGR